MNFKNEEKGMSRVITGGLVSFEDGVKAAEEYAPARKVRVELNFEVPEDFPGSAEEALDSVAKMAKAKVGELLGKATKNAASGIASVAQAEPGTAAPAVRTKADLAAEAGLPEAPKKPGRPPKVKPDLNPAGDEWDVPSTTAAVEISDADLLSEIGKRNAVLKDPQAIRALVAEFSGGKVPFSAKEIPQDQRASFIEKLKTLKPAV